MTEIKFISVDQVNRTATFTVDEEEVTRKIPLVFEGTIDDYLRALASGLAVEAAQKNAVVSEIGTPSLEQGEVLN